MDAWISVASAPCRRDCKPHFIRCPQALHSLQQQIEAEAELHFHDGESRRLRIAHRDDVAAANLALYLKTCCFQEALHGRIQSGFGYAAPFAQIRLLT